MGDVVCGVPIFPSVALKIKVWLSWFAGSLPCLRTDCIHRRQSCSAAVSFVQYGVYFIICHRIEQEDSNLKCRFTPLSVGNHTYIGKNCVVESAGIGCNVRIEDGCVLVSLRLD